MKRCDKYAVDLLYNWKGSYHAGSKARNDVSRTLEELGYKNVGIRHRNYKSKAFTSFIRKLQIIWLYYSHLATAQIVIFQYPGVISHWLLKKLKKKGCRIIMLIHDIESIREERCFNEKEIFNYADNIISHTKNMTNTLVDNGVNSSIHEIYIFDYYVKEENVHQEKDLTSIAFCGNLGKSHFIYELDNSKWQIHTYLYGIDCNTEFTNANLEYMGKFESDDISSLKGAWGLVWDGNSPESCDTTPIGRYLRFNSSHKVSLYIVAEKPLIVWNKSALAEFVTDKGLGIAIDSLYNIDIRIRNITKEEYGQFLLNIRELKKSLVNGEILKSAIKSIEHYV